MKHTSKNEYWVDPTSGKPRFEFDEMYNDLGDPWGCEDKKNSLTNRIFLEMLLDEDSDYKKIIDLGSGKGALSDSFYRKYLQIKQNLPRIEAGDTDSISPAPFEMIGLEYSEVAVQEAKKLNPNIQFQTFNLLQADSIPYQDVDLVILSEVLWYLVSDLSNVFQKIHHCLSGRKDRKNYLAIHQYFPGNQKYFKEFIDGETGFELFLAKEGLFKIQDKIKFFHNNGDSVLLYKLAKL